MDILGFWIHTEFVSHDPKASCVHIRAHEHLRRNNAYKCVQMLFTHWTAFKYSVSEREVYVLCSWWPSHLLKRAESHVAHLCLYAYIVIDNNIVWAQILKVIHDQAREVCKYQSPELYEQIFSF